MPLGGIFGLLEGQVALTHDGLATGQLIKQ